MAEIAFAITGALAVLFWRFSGAEAAWRLRVASAVGIFALLGLGVLGLSWPSLYTGMALVALPALGLLFAALFRPELLHRTVFRLYSRLSVSLCPVAFGIQVWWAHRLAAA